MPNGFMGSRSHRLSVDMISLCHCAIDGLLARARPRGGAPNLLSCLIPHPRTIMGGNCCHALSPQSKPALDRPSSGGLLTRARLQAGSPSVHELSGSRNHRLPESSQWTWYPCAIDAPNCCHAISPQSTPTRPKSSSGGLLARARPQAGAPNVHELTGSRSHRFARKQPLDMIPCALDVPSINSL